MEDRWQDGNAAKLLVSMMDDDSRQKDLSARVGIYVGFLVPSQAPAMIMTFLCVFVPWKCVVRS